MSTNFCTFAADLKKFGFIIVAFFSVMAGSAMTREEAFAAVDSAYALAMAGEMQQAIALNNDGLSAVPEDSMAIRCEFYSCLLYCYHRLGDYQQALFYGEACLAFDEQDGDPANISASLGNLAGIYSSAGQHDVAVRYLERAIAIEESLLASDSTHSPKSLAIRKAMLGEVLLAKSRQQSDASNQPSEANLQRALQLTEEALAIDRSL
jgi:tetratricopeptide (TPR) repeat protein